MAAEEDHNASCVLLNEEAHIKSEEEAYVKCVRVFRCENNNTRNDDVGEEEEEYQGLLLFKIRDKLHTGRPGSISESIEQFPPESSYLGLPFTLDVFVYLDDEDSSNWFDLMGDIVDQSGLFGSSSGRVAREVCSFLRSCFRVKTWTFDSIVIVVDVERFHFPQEYYLEAKEKHRLDYVHSHGVMVDDNCDVGVDETEKIVGVARSWWAGERWRDMEMEEVGARVDKMEVRPVEGGNCATRGAKKRGREEEEEEECSICLRTLAGKVAKKSRVRWLPESHSTEIVRLKCGHGFHHKCIFKWLSKKPSCPNCRSSCLTTI